MEPSCIGKRIIVIVLQNSVECQHLWIEVSEVAIGLNCARLQGGAELQEVSDVYILRKASTDSRVIGLGDSPEDCAENSGRQG